MAQRFDAQVYGAERELIYLPSVMKSSSDRESFRCWGQLGWTRWVSVDLLRTAFVYRQNQISIYRNLIEHHSLNDSYSAGRDWHRRLYALSVTQQSHTMHSGIISNHIEPYEYSRTLGVIGVVEENWEELFCDPSQLPLVFVNRAFRFQAFPVSISGPNALIPIEIRPQTHEIRSKRGIHAKRHDRWQTSEILKKN